MSDKAFMLLTAFVSILCAVWACFVPAFGMTAAMIANAILSVILAFKLEKMV